MFKDGGKTMLEDGDELERLKEEMSKLIDRV